MSHRIELNVLGNISYSKDFKTFANAENKSPLSQHEVIIWNTKNEYDVVKIEWADRCIETYRLDICQFPYDCRQDPKDSLYFRTFNVSNQAQIEATGTSSLDEEKEVILYPKQTVTDLLPCAFYSFDIYSQ